MLMFILALPLPGCLVELGVTTTREGLIVGIEASTGVDGWWYVPHLVRLGLAEPVPFGWRVEIHRMLRGPCRDAGGLVVPLESISGPSF